MKLVTRITLLLFLGIVAAVTVGAATLWISGLLSVDETNGERALTGLEAQVAVQFDENGIPTIRAESMTDAYRALGYLHARDRLWQMESMRRVGAGRMAEVVGRTMLSFDILMRELGLVSRAEKQVAALAPAERQALDAYTAGVNTYLETRSTPLPVSFQLLFHEPEPWRPADSLLWAGMMSMQLSGDAFGEAMRADLITRVGVDRIHDLLPPNDTAPTTMNDDNRDGWIGEYDASNAWVIDGAHTATGSPILANDPHLGIRMPGQWYMARIETPELTLVGATAAGVPFHVLGHNGTIAWGMTTTHADNQDSVRLTQQQLDALQVTEMEVPVRFSDPERITLRQSEFGPVLSRLGGGTALQWTADNGLPQTASALFRVNRARNWTEFRAALAQFNDPVQNIFYADTGGHIGMKVAGRVPIRAEGHDGSLPLDADDPAARWRGTVESDALPGLYDPTEGVIYNANNRVIDGAYPHVISHSFRSGYRAVRLGEMLAETMQQHDLADSMAIQTDILSESARRLVPILITADSSDATAMAARNLLSDWDFRMDRDAAAPAVYATMMNQLVRVLAEDELGDALDSWWRTRERFVEVALTTAPHWCDDIRTETKEDCTWALRVALERASLWLVEEMGNDPADWRWGAIHRAPMKHLPLSVVPGLSSLGNQPIETSGGNDTLARGQSHGGSNTRPFDHVLGASFRAIYDLSDLDNSLFALAGGQSGNPFSPNYSSLLTDWRDGRYFRIPGRAGDIPDDEGTVLILRP